MDQRVPSSPWTTHLRKGQPVPPSSPLSDSLLGDGEIERESRQRKRGREEEGARFGFSFSRGDRRADPRAQEPRRLRSRVAAPPPLLTRERPSLPGLLAALTTRSLAALRRRFFFLSSSRGCCPESSLVLRLPWGMPSAAPCEPLPGHARPLIAPRN
ncbi:hypothetical protein Taro_030763 [Colocasia esculenta]|uniref:Uncharacterized protein n=1 Tax=Colocasia esculenta TaxID=4460 RepID=A0A843VN78_COLES|nr:hypothetical protein [Colocasia esculenta]